MHRRVLLLVGLGILLLFGGCEHPTSLFGKNSGECKYKEYSVNQNSATIECLQSGNVTDHILGLDCNGDESPFIYIASTIIFNHHAKLLAVDFYFDDKKFTIDNWSYDLQALSLGVPILESGLYGQLMTRFETAEKLSYEFARENHKINLSEYSEEFTKFATSCKKNKWDQDSVLKYLKK